MKNLKTLFALLTISLVLLSCNTNEHIYDDDIVEEQFSGKRKTFIEKSNLSTNASSVPPPPPPGLVDLDIITSPRDGDSFITGYGIPVTVPLRWDESKISSNDVIIKEYKLNGANPPTLLSSFVTQNDGSQGSSSYQIGDYRYEIYNSSNILKDSSNFSVDED